MPTATPLYALRAVGKSYGGRRALAAGELDAYVEYSGTALRVILEASDRAVDSLVATDGVRDYLGAAFAKTGLAWAVELGFENTYALVVREAPAGGARVSALAVR